MGAIIIVGDSFSAYHPTMKAWPYTVAERTGAWIIDRAIWGTGYIDEGPGPGNQPQRFLRQALFQANPPLVSGFVIAGSVNDQDQDPNLYRAMTLMTHLQIMNTFPQAKIMVVGPWWSGPNLVPANVLRCRDILLETMWSYDWKYPLVDPIKDNLFPSNRPEFWAPEDQFHPNQAGYDRIADYMQPKMKQYFGI